MEGLAGIVDDARLQGNRLGAQIFGLISQQFQGDRCDLRDADRRNQQDEQPLDQGFHSIIVRHLALQASHKTPFRASQLEPLSRLGEKLGA